MFLNSCVFLNFSRLFLFAEFETALIKVDTFDIAAVEWAAFEHLSHP